MEGNQLPESRGHAPLWPVGAAGRLVRGTEPEAGCPPLVQGAFIRTGKVYSSYLKEPTVGLNHIWRQPAALKSLSVIRHGGFAELTHRAECFDVVAGAGGRSESRWCWVERHLQCLCFFCLFSGMDVVIRIQAFIRDAPICRYACSKPEAPSSSLDSVHQKELLPEEIPARRTTHESSCRS